MRKLWDLGRIDYINSGHLRDPHPRAGPFHVEGGRHAYFVDHSRVELMSTAQRHLAVVKGRSARIDDNQFRVAAQANVEGVQDISVEAATALAEPGRDQIAVRVGRFLANLNDREVLESFGDTWRRAEALADKAFGPLDLPHHVRD